jgi:hypothetical protein
MKKTASNSYLHFVIVFSNTITPRLQYITGFVKGEIGVSELRLTTNIEEYKNSGDQKINYSSQRIMPDEFWVCPHSLLFEKKSANKGLNALE